VPAAEMLLKTIWYSDCQCCCGPSN